MLDAGELALAFLVFALVLHAVSIGLSVYRCTRSVPHRTGAPEHPPVALIRPICGIDQYDALTLQSTFELSYPNYEALFCCASTSDPVVALITGLLNRSASANAKLLIGDDRSTSNPKLNNLIKGWSAAHAPWIILADSNVLLPPDYIETLLSAWRAGTGLVCSPPVGCMPEGFFAEIECAMLNGYQARWQLAADTIGFGFAQGKSMLWRRDILEAEGGIRALGSEIAEDAAATKIVRMKGLRVRLVDRPFSQPLGRRSARQVWERQLRWARLRRATFPAYFIPEVLTGFVPPCVATLVSAPVFEIDRGLAITVLLAVWYLPEAILNRVARWQVSPWSPFAWLARDLLLPVVWSAAWFGNGFSWRGNEMSVVPAALGTQR